VPNPDSSQDATAVELAVYCPGAVQSLVRPLLDAYAAASGNRVKFESFTTGAIVQRVTDGAPGDVVIATSEGIATLAEAGRVDRASVRRLGGIGLGVAVRRGTRVPDITDIESFKRAMLAAISITYSDPAAGGQSGIRTAEAMDKIGIADAIGPRLQIRQRGTDGFKEVGQGKIEIGLGPISEILANKELVLVAPFPPEIQSSVNYSAAVHAENTHKEAAQNLVASLVSPAAKAKFQAAGFVTD
jgi:molybdate transport system substrate-binding protein